MSQSARPRLRQITRGGDQPSFGPNGTVIFRQQETNANYLYRINKDGSGAERILSRPILNKASVSPDGEWVIVNRALLGDDAAIRAVGMETVAVSLRGGAATTVCSFNCMPNWSWSLDGKFVYAATPQGGTMVLPVATGRSLPELPESGIPSTVDASMVPGARVIDRVALPGPTASTYLFQKSEIRRNLFRIELR